MSTDEVEDNCQESRKELHKIDEEISELEGREGEFRQDTYKIGELKKRRAVVLSHLKARGCQDQSGFN